MAVKNQTCNRQKSTKKSNNCSSFDC